MAGIWIPHNWEEVCKRNAGRRKLHMRKRRGRSRRIICLLAAMEKAPKLREAVPGLLAIVSETMQISKATASRDLALAQRIHQQFFRVFGRPLTSNHDEIVWSWDWSHYGFRTVESRRAGHRKAICHFPFDTRDVQPAEEAFEGFNPLSFQRLVNQTPGQRDSLTERFGT
jgi:hypothetical protein